MKTLLVWWAVFALSLVPIGWLFAGPRGAATGAVVALGAALLIGGACCAAGSADDARQSDS